MARWFDRFKEKEGRRGLVPWLAVDMQKWALIWAICLGAIVIVAASVVHGAFLAVLAAVATGFLCYVGIKTSWVAKVDNVNKTVRVVAGIIMVVGLLAGIVFLAYAVVMVVMLVLFLIILAVIVSSLLGTRKPGKIEGDIGEAFSGTEVIRPKWFGPGSNLISKSGIKVGDIQKAWLSDDQIIKAPDGTKIGTLRQHALRKDVQVIIDANHEEVGEIRTDAMGRREIVDGEGNRVGIIEKDIWGRTTITHDQKKDDR